MRNLKGKVSVVTGAGSGIGRATAMALAEHGAAVAACDLHADSAKSTADAIASRGGNASSHQVDVASEDEMRALVEAVISEHGVVDIVVNNAGVLSGPTPAEDIPLDHFRRIMDINFWGVVYGSCLFLPHLKRRPEANLVNVASNAAIMAYARIAAYNSSKFAVRGFTETLRMELRKTPVRVTVVCPGNTKTSLVENSPVIEKAQREDMQRFVHRMYGRPPEAVASAIVEGIQRNRPRVLTGADTKGIDVIARFLPGGHSRLLAPIVEKFMDMSVGGSR